MIPIGYLYKLVAAAPDWLTQVRDVYSLSDHISHDFSDYINYWKHNGFWLFNEPEIMEEIAKAEDIDLSQAKLFYYEAYEFEYDEDSETWSPYYAYPDFETNVRPPKEKVLEGFDVATFSLGNTPEDSPLCCNALANRLPVNEHCLFRTFEEAKQALDAGAFNNSEPGPFRIIAVYSLKLR